jgi:hypothetical protein
MLTHSLFDLSVNLPRLTIGAESGAQWWMRGAVWRFVDGV